MSHRSNTLSPEYLEAVRSMSSSTMNRACEILLQEDDEDDSGSADEILAMYRKCQSAFAVIQKHQPRLAPSMASNSGGSLLKTGGSINTNPLGANLSLPLRKKSMLSAAAGASNSVGSISAKHGIMRGKKSLVPHGRRSLNDAISGDSPLAKKPRLHGSNNSSSNGGGGKSTASSEAPPKSALNFLNKLNRGSSKEGNGGNSSRNTSESSSSSTTASAPASSSSARNQPTRSTASLSASSSLTSTRSQPVREARNASSSSSGTPPTRSQPSRSSRRGSTSS